MKWETKIINKIIIKLKLNRDGLKQGIHLAVFNEPYLSLILSGEKTIESRFSINMISPFNKLASGDIILLQKSGGNILGAFEAGEVIYYSNLNSKKLKEIESKFGKQICSKYDEAFWHKRKNVKYGTLIGVKNIKLFEEIKSGKTDRRGWVILRSSDYSSLFDLGS